jgi:hypothetical protein
VRRIVSAVTAGPRDYLTGSQHALLTLSQGSCYHPECDRHVISWTDASTPGSPRYDLDMTDEERRSFPNLILVCKPHHDLIYTSSAPMTIWR